MSGETWRCESFLRQEYQEKGKAMSTIAEENGTNYNRVRNALIEFEIDKRGCNETRYFDTQQRLKNNRGEIIERYTENATPLYKLSQDYNVDDATLKRHLNEWGIETRGIGEQHRASSDYPKLNDPEWLREQYREKRKYTPQIAEEVGCSEHIVYHYLKHHGIEIFDHGETISGEENMNWKGDAREHTYYGSNWLEQRQRALDRDNRKCQACNIDENEHQEQYGRGLSVHHIIRINDFDSTVEANKLSNLITLCRSCHKTWERIPVVPQNG